jgi:MinD superfamily P-loop ATPase
MKQLVILSGKGGTGKTTAAAALAHLAAEGPNPVRAILADADVDAANLELVLAPRELEKHEFMGGQVAIIDQEVCLGCGICRDVCRFEAVSVDDGLYDVDPIACEGCAVCFYQCPEEAIRMEEQLAGHWFRSESRYGPLFHAELRPAQENSGRLVTMVKQQARLLARDKGHELVIVDGPPGIGCPVISAMAGADLALVVTEPTAAGIHDMERVLATANHFGIPLLVCINKADLYSEGTARIEEFCRSRGIGIAGHIPFDVVVTKAMVRGQPVTAYQPDGKVAQALRAVWARVLEELEASSGQLSQSFG